MVTLKIDENIHTWTQNRLTTIRVLVDLFSQENVSAKVSSKEPFKPSPALRAPRASAAHVSLSSIFSCQRSDMTKSYRGLHRLLLLPCRVSLKAALLKLSNSAKLRDKLFSRQQRRRRRW